MKSAEEQNRSQGGPYQAYKAEKLCDCEADCETCCPEKTQITKQTPNTIHKAEPQVQDNKRKGIPFRTVFFILGAILFVLLFFLPLSQAEKLAAYLISYILIGGEVLLNAGKNIAKGYVFDEKFLMSVATIGAFFAGDYAEGVAVMLFYRIGEYFEDLAVGRSRKSIAALMNIRPDYANLKNGNEIQKVSPQEIAVGDYILIRPGEKVPLDGIVTEGKSFLDTSALTGESRPRTVSQGSEIFSGSVNQSGVLTVRVTKTFGESTVTKILDLVQNASSRKAPAENFITKFAKIYTPVVVFSAVALAVFPPLLIPGASFSDWLSRALTFLVVSCPCALVLSIPLSFFGGIGTASRHGILVKGGNYLEALNNIGTVVFDKTGTLTKGCFRVTKISPAAGITNDELLALAAHAELYSNHPIALSIREAYGKEPIPSEVSDYEEISGKGIQAKVYGKNILAGNTKLLDDAEISHPIPAEIGTVVYLAVNENFAGFFIISDELKPDSKEAIRRLENRKIHTVMLTGDSKAAGEKTADELGMDACYTELLPQQKVLEMEKLKSEVPAEKKIVFVGDGVNDAPVLACADIGIAMGGLGSDAAIEAADVVLMTDEPSKLLTAMRIAGKTHAIVRENIIFALGVKLLILILAGFGAATMWEAVFGDVGVAILSVLNSIRVTTLVKPKQGH